MLRHAHAIEFFLTIRLPNKSDKHNTYIQNDFSREIKAEKPVNLRRF